MRPDVIRTASAAPIHLASRITNEPCADTMPEQNVIDADFNQSVFANESVMQSV